MHVASNRYSTRLLKLNQFIISTCCVQSTAATLIAGRCNAVGQQDVAAPAQEKEPWDRAMSPKQHNIVMSERCSVTTGPQTATAAPHTRSAVSDTQIASCTSCTTYQISSIRYRLHLQCHTEKHVAAAQGCRTQKASLMTHQRCLYFIQYKGQDKLR